MADTIPLETKESSLKTFSLDEYLTRIRFTGKANPDLDTLKAIHLLHPRYIPFENLNPLLRIPVKLDLDSLSRKILTEKRGGYCFEQNLLLKAVLERIGFQVKGLAARVLWGQSPDAITPRGHMLLRVTVDDQDYIADVGFGGQTLTSPLLLKSDIEQLTPHEPFRLIERDGDYRLESFIRGEWKALYRFDLRENFQVDYEVTSWYLSNHPTSHFVTGLIAARTEADRRYALRNNELATHYLNEDTDKRVIKDADELAEVLANVFGLRIPDRARLSEALQKIVTH
jgi:N-hydroxyarylamine O-acetyltransferase